MQFLGLFIGSLLAATASAQLQNLPVCAQGCVGGFTSGDQIGGCGALDIACICGAQDFIGGISCCLMANCNQADQQTSIKFAHQICTTAGVQVPSEVDCPNPAKYGYPANIAAGGASANASSTTMSMTMTGTAATMSMTGTMTGTATGTKSATASASASGSYAAPVVFADVGLGIGSLVSFLAMMVL